MSLEVTIIKRQLQSCVAQRDQSAQTFQQCVGAIAVLEEQLKVVLMEEAKKHHEVVNLEQEQLNSDYQEDIESVSNAIMESCQGGIKNGEVKQQTSIEAPKE